VVITLVAVGLLLSISRFAGTEKAQSDVSDSRVYGRRSRVA